MKSAATELALAAEPQVELFMGDLGENAFQRALREGVVSWDIETTGLDWRTERIGTVQLQIDTLSCVIQIGRRTPRRLKILLETQGVLKIMHHAMFDLRFVAHNWRAAPQRVACTKIAAKLARPHAPSQEHSLASLVSHHFGVELDKSQRITDWTANLTQEQLRYAVDDVRYLQPLHAELHAALRSRRLIGLRERCYAHLPTRVELELGGYPDVFAY